MTDNLSKTKKVWESIWYQRNKIAVEWNSFDDFLKDMGPIPMDGRLARDSRKEGFNKNNCYWIVKGLSREPWYSIWSSMRSRCLNSNTPYYPNYGGRGIKVCNRWRRSASAFFEDMGPQPENTSLERVDNDGDYTPENCCWAPKLEQMRNRRSVLQFEKDGQIKNGFEWAEYFKLKAKASTAGGKFYLILFERDGEEKTFYAWAEYFGLKFVGSPSRARRAIESMPDFFPCV